MLFTSSIFLYGFLPTTLIFFYILSRFSSSSKLVIHFLIFVSFIFYGWTNPYNIILLSFSIIVNFNLGRSIQTGEFKNLKLLAGIIFNLCLLGYFKYTNFIFENLSILLNSGLETQNIILPLAISFYTFQQIAYISDCRNGKINDDSFINYCLFVSFFPQLIIGPIVHHKEIIPQFLNVHLGRFNWDNLIIGSLYLFSGMIKKIILSDEFNEYVNTIFYQADGGQFVSFFDAWTAALAFSMQIYFDFSGYSDMALGIAKLFGINIPINFNSPYKAANVAEFWRRWHITLSRWLRDYLYIPLGGNRKSIFRSATNALIVFIIGGLWHGAAWQFVLWGLLQGIGISIGHFLNSLYSKFNISSPKYVGVFSTFIFMVFSWVLFRAETIEGALIFYQSMLGISEINAKLNEEINLLFLSICLVCVFIFPNTNELIPKLVQKVRAIPKQVIITVLIVCWVSLAAFDIDSSIEFIYFDF